MISKFELTSSDDAAAYYDAALVEDGQEAEKKADNYYANETASALWQGEGAKLLGIEGEKVDRDDFVALLDGKLKNPRNGEMQDLAKNSKGEDRRLGYDFTISAPKSVSIAGLVGGDARIVEAHLAANKAAMQWLEKHGAQVRVKEDGQNKTVTTGNLIYASVQHETSRANDPQLHNHNVIVAASYDQDAGKWRSLTNDELFRIRTTADTIYKNELARGLRSIGYQVDYAADGRDFEIRGISGEQLASFSSRTREINEALKQQGIDPESASWAARQAAALDSRAAKHDLGKSVLSEIWREKALESGLNLDTLVQEARDRAESGKALLEDKTSDAQIAVTRAINHLSEREQAFKASELESTAVFFAEHRSSISAIQDAIAERKAEKSLVDRPDSKANMLTTSAAISQELTLQDSIEQGRGRGLQVISSEAEFQQALSSFEARKTEEVGKPFKLSGEQINAARNVLMHEDKFQGIQGDAGTGKTAALEFVREAAENRGWLLQGIATSSTGAKELGHATGMPSQTVAAFMIERDKQLDVAKAELDKLAIKIANSPGTAARVKLVERRDMSLGNDAAGATPARYVFDNKTGDVFKSELGLGNPLNVIGHKLIDSGTSRAESAETSLQGTKTFAERFAAQSNLMAGKLQTTLGRSLVSYEQVGMTEALAARDLHEAEKEREHNSLASAYAKTAAKVENLERTGNAEGKKFLLVMDESSMTGTKDSARLSEIARDLGARVVLQGDVKQHGSVAAGQAMLQTHEAKINLSIIEETRRFDNATPQTQRAIKEMKLGRYSTALAGLDTTIVSGGESLAEATAGRYIANYLTLVEGGQQQPKVGVVALTNNDRKDINLAIRQNLQQRDLMSKENHRKDHLDDPKLTEAQRRHARSLQIAGVDRMTALRDYDSLGIRKQETLAVVGFNFAKNEVTLRREDNSTVTINPDRSTKFSVARAEIRDYSQGEKIEARANIGRRNDPQRVTNGTKGVIREIDAKGAIVAWEDGKTTQLTNSELRHVDHAYARTSYKEQGVTNQVEIFAVSQTGAKIINRHASYVAASRAKGNTEIVTNAQEEMLKNAGREAQKTTAIDLGENVSQSRINAGLDKAKSQTTEKEIQAPHQERAVPAQEKKVDRPGQELTR